MQRSTWVAAAFVVAIAGTILAADVKSGLQVGESPGEFNVKDVTVLMWKASDVKAKFAFTAGALDAKAIKAVSDNTNTIL